MTQKTENETKRQIAAFLPDAILRALNSYHLFSQQSVPEEAKEFSAHHNACKIAIAHIELLIKLARWADLPDPKAGDHNNQIVISALMQEAQNEVNKHHGDFLEEEDKDE